MRYQRTCSREMISAIECVVDDTSSLRAVKREERAWLTTFNRGCYVSGSERSATANLCILRPPVKATTQRRRGFACVRSFVGEGLIKRLS